MERQSALPTVDARVDEGVAARANGHRRSRWLGAWRAFAKDRTSVAALVFLLAVVAASLLAPYLSPHGPYEAVAARNAPPMSEGLWLGADNDGRDVLTRLLWGGRVSLIAGLLPTILATIASLLLGTAAGYIGGLFDQVLMRILDVFFAFPLVLVAVVVAGILTPGLFTITVAIFIALVPYIARLTRVTTQTVKAEPYVEAARAGGAGEMAIVLRYILPNTIAPVIVYATTLVGMMMVLASALSFLGLGVQPPTADWGLMIAEGRTVLRRAPHVTIFPGALIVLVALSFGFLGDGIRDALDPRLRTR